MVEPVILGFRVAAAAQVLPAQALSLVVVAAAATVAQALQAAEAGATAATAVLLVQITASRANRERPTPLRQVLQEAQAVVVAAVEHPRA